MAGPSSAWRSDIAPYFRHIDRRFHELRQDVLAGAYVTIDGIGDEPSLGRGGARAHWVAAFGDVAGVAMWRLVVQRLSSLSLHLHMDFQGRVRFGNVREQDVEPGHILVWGADAISWALPNGSDIPGAGQAVARGKKVVGVFGIVTTPSRGPPTELGGPGSDGYVEASSGNAVEVQQVAPVLLRVDPPMSQGLPLEHRNTGSDGTAAADISEGASDGQVLAAGPASASASASAPVDLRVAYSEVRSGEFNLAEAFIEYMAFADEGRFRNALLSQPTMSAHFDRATTTRGGVRVPHQLSLWMRQECGKVLLLLLLLQLS